MKSFELVAFIRARLEEDAEAARKAAALCGCHPPALSWSFRDGDEPTDGRILVVDDPHPDLKRKISRRWNGSYEGLLMARHIVRHDPARILAEVKAKRCLLYQFEHRGDSVRAVVKPSTGGVWDDLLRLLALPYASHPDYRPEWRP